jgi:hypothetical protein
MASEKEEEYEFGGRETDPNLVVLQRTLRMFLLPISNILVVMNCAGCRQSGGSGT